MLVNDINIRFAINADTLIINPIGANTKRSEVKRRAGAKEAKHHSKTFPKETSKKGTKKELTRTGDKQKGRSPSEAKRSKAKEVINQENATISLICSIC